MKRLEGQDLDALLMDLLYEEGNGASVDPELQQELSARFAETLEAYREIRAAYQALPDEDPAPQVSALLLQQAAKAVEDLNAPGLLDQFLSWFRSPSMGLAGVAAAAVLIVGVSVFVVERGSMHESVEANLGDPVNGLPAADLPPSAATSTPKNDDGVLAEAADDDGWTELDGKDRGERTIVASAEPTAPAHAAAGDDLGGSGGLAGGDLDESRRRADTRDPDRVALEKAPEPDVTVAGKLEATKRVSGSGDAEKLPAGGEGEVWMDGRPGTLGRDTSASDKPVGTPKPVLALRSKAKDSTGSLLPAAPMAGPARDGAAAAYSAPVAAPHASTGSTSSGSYYRGAGTKKPADTATMTTTDEAKGLSRLAEAGRLFRERKFAPAAAAAREAMNLYPATNPSRAKAARFYGLSMLAVGNCDEARLAVGYVGGASKTDLRFKVGACYETRGSFTAAISVYKDVKIEDPENSELAGAKITALEAKVTHAGRKAKAKPKASEKKKSKKGDKKSTSDEDEAAEEPTKSAF